MTQGQSGIVSEGDYHGLGFKKRCTYIYYEHRETRDFCLIIKGRKGSSLAQKVFDLSNGEGGRRSFCDGYNFGRSIVGPG